MARDTRKKAPVMKLYFIDLKNEVQKSGLNILVYGGFGTGKSHFCLSAPEPIYVIDTEGGIKPLFRNFKDKDIPIELKLDFDNLFINIMSAYS